MQTGRAADSGGLGGGAALALQVLLRLAAQRREPPRAWLPCTGAAPRPDPRSARSPGPPPAAEQEAREWLDPLGRDPDEARRLPRSRGAPRPASCPRRRAPSARRPSHHLPTSRPCSRPPSPSACGTLLNQCAPVRVSPLSPRPQGLPRVVARSSVKQEERGGQNSFFLDDPGAASARVEFAGTELPPPLAWRYGAELPPDL